MTRATHFGLHPWQGWKRKMALILPARVIDEIKDDAASRGPLEVVSRKDRREVLNALGTLHKLFQTTAIRFPESDLKDRQRVEVETLARKLLGDGVAFEVLT